MKSPKDMKIIQIDITNACINRCSNCTRFCGHHTRPFFMDFETFKSQMPGADSITEDMTWGDANKIIEAAYAAQQAQQTDDSSAASDTESSPSPDAAADSGKDN